MSYFEEDRQPGPPAASEDREAASRLEPAPQRESEPRLLLRSTTSESLDLPKRVGWPKRREPIPRWGLRAWFSAQLQRGKKATPGQESQARPLSSRRARRVLLGLLLLPLLLGLLGLGWVLSLRHAAVAALPALDGDALVPGLRSVAMVTRDAQGVPSITALGLHDVLFAQGYTTAGDRLWQMDALRRHGAGELAEILGPSLLAHDQRQRILQIRAAADRALGHLPADQRAELQAYADGVNSYIDSHRGSLPLEFGLLAYKPAPWTPRDSLLVLLVMFQDMSTRFPQKLDREALSAGLPADLLPDLYPVGSWRDSPPAAQDHSISAPHAVELIPLDPSQARAVPPTPRALPSPLALPSAPGAQIEDLLAASQVLGGTGGCPDCRAGSNNWAVSGQRTASGKPLLANDTHLNLGIPDIWYEIGLHTAEPPTIADGGAPTAGATPLDAVGFSLPGLPFIVIGRNAGVAWGVTNLGADTQEIRVEHLRGAGAATEFQRPDGSWAPLGHHPELIRVRGGRDRTLDVRFTTHPVGAGTMETPLISPLFPTEGRALSLAWTAYDPATLALPLLAANTAVNGQALAAAFATFGGPTLNLLWADTGGHIGYHAIGLVPVRGPAIPHPRATPTPEPVPTGNPVTDEDEGKQARLPPGTMEPAPGTTWQRGRDGAHLVWSAYFAPFPRRSGARTRRRAARASRRAASRSAVPSPAGREPEPALATGSARDYTVGSPTSPVPVDALNAGMEWSGYIGYSDLPAVTDPAGGVLATANSRVTPDDYPWAVTDDWADPFRTERIVHLLRGRTGLTPADMLRIDNDVHSDAEQAMGQRLAYALDHASAGALGKDARRLHQAADTLRAWDGQMDTNSSGAAVLTAVREALWPALLVPQLQGNAAGDTHDPHDAHGNRRTISAAQAAQLVNLYTWGERTTALELLLQNQPARWLPANFANWNDFLASAAERGLQASHAPSDLSRWSYGQRHTVEIAHPIFGEHRPLARLLGVTATTGSQPAPGDFTTIKAIGAHFGPSERFIADLASPDGALGNVTTGESGQGRSAWYLDQFRAWLEGRSFPLPRSGTVAKHTLRLLPAGGGS